MEENMLPLSDAWFMGLCPYHTLFIFIFFCFAIANSLVISLFELLSPHKLCFTICINLQSSLISVFVVHLSESLIFVFNDISCFFVYILQWTITMALIRQQRMMGLFVKKDILIIDRTFGWYITITVYFV